MSEAEKKIILIPDSTDLANGDAILEALKAEGYSIAEKAIGEIAGGARLDVILVITARNGLTDGLRTLGKEGLEQVRAVAIISGGPMIVSSIRSTLTTLMGDNVLILTSSDLQDSNLTTQITGHFDRENSADNSPKEMTALERLAKILAEKQESGA